MLHLLIWPFHLRVLFLSSVVYYDRFSIELCNSILFVRFSISFTKSNQPHELLIRWFITLSLNYTQSCFTFCLVGIEREILCDDVGSQLLWRKLYGNDFLPFWPNLRFSPISIELLIFVDFHHLISCWCNLGVAFLLLTWSYSHLSISQL